MIRVEPNDVMFAGAGILWGIVTMARGMKIWHRRLMMIGMFITAICAGYLTMAFAEAAPAKTYLEQLQIKLDHAARRANQPTSGSANVIGLRGSKQEPLSKQLYWKGKTGPEPVSPEEIKEFRTAVEKANAGKTDEAVPALNAFVEKYPKSPLKPDAEETLRVLTSTQ